MAAHPERWYFTREQLQNTPSRKCGVEPEKELSYRQQSANLIQDMGQRLQVNQLCINTAIVYMHRFYMFQPFTRFPRNSISAACLFLAAKVEEQPHKLEHVLKVAHLCLHRGGPPLDTKSDAYMQQTQELVINESIILQTFAFDVAVSHPHTHVVKCTQMIRASKDLAQTSYFMATNSLHLTTFCLQYKPTIVACVCVHLACKWSLYEIPKSSDGNYWWEYVDPNVNRELLDQLTMEFLQIIEACPNRLKRRIAIHKQQALNSKQAKKELGTEDTDGTVQAGKPGSQSSLDSGVGDLNEDSHKLLALPPHMSSPWLSKQSKEEQKLGGDFGKPGQSSRAPDKLDLTEPSQPAKKSLEEYRQQKEKERKLQEQKQKEEKEKMKLEKMKQEKRRLHEAAQRAAHDAKSRPKIPPPPPPPPGGHRKPDHLHHQSVSRHSTERPGEHPAKVKSTLHTDPHMRQAQEHHSVSAQSDRDKRHRPPPPNMVEGSHSVKPSHSHKKPHPVPPHQHPKDSRHHVQHKDQIRGSVPMKTERTDERKTLDDKHRASGSHKPHHPDSRKPLDNLVHKSLGKREAPVPKAETPSLLQKAQLIKEKTQAQKDEEQRINDDLSDIRDEIMRDLEQETIGDPVTLPQVEAIPAVVERKRNSLDNLRQVAVEELMHMKKSDAESSKPHPTVSGSASESKVSRDTSHNEMKPSVKLKGEGKGGHNPSPGNLQLSPSKKLKSPAKVKGESHKSSKIISPNLGTPKNDSPLAKKKVLDLTSHSSKNLDEMQHKQSDKLLSQTVKVEKPNIVLEQPQSEHMFKSSESSQHHGYKTEKMPTKRNEQEQIKNVAPSKSNLIKEEPKLHAEVDKLTKASHGTVHGTRTKTEVKTEPDVSVSVSLTKSSLEGHLSLQDTVQGIKPLSPPSPPTVHEVKDEQIPPSSKGAALSKVQELKETADSLPSVLQQSPKQKHRHKEKKKHKKHRQEKQMESSGSPNLETTSILTKSGGIKLKIKGLSSSFSGGSPSEASKSQPEHHMSNSAGSIPLKLTSSPNSGREKDHKQRHKHGKSKSHSRKRSLSPSGETSMAPSKKKSSKEGGMWNNSSQSGLPESQSLLSLPMPPPDPQKVSPSKHSTTRRNRQPPPPPPPPPPPRSPEDSPPPPPPPPPQPISGSSSPLTTVTALPSMDAMPMDPYPYSNQYLMYPGMGIQPGNGGVSHQNSSVSRHGGQKQPPYV